MNLLLILSAFLGVQYGDAVKGTNIDPMIISTNEQAREAFSYTLSGPQTGGIAVKLEGRDLIVWETCQAHLCASNHSVIALDTKSKEVYAITYTDEEYFTLVDAPFAHLIDRACKQVSCDFEGASDQRGELVRGEALSQRDMSGALGGANCIAINEQGETVLYTEGVGFVRVNGRLRRIVEDGIGGPELYSDDGAGALAIEIVERAGIPSRVDYELSERPVIINILSDDKWVSILATYRCES